MIHKIHLEFFGPYPLANEKDDILSNCEYSDKAGIYLWTIRMPNGAYKISYLGETGRSFYLRMKEHVLNQLSGLYSIYDPHSLSQGIRKVIWAGLLGKNRKDKLPEYLSKYVELAPSNMENIKMQSIFLAPLKVEPAVQKRIESAIIHELRKDTEASSLLTVGVRYRKHIPGKENIKVKILSPVKLIGLPGEVYV